MRSERQYNIYYCGQCSQEFLSPSVKGRHTRQRYCPLCADDVEVTREGSILLPRKLYYHKKRYTEEEDQAIIYGYKRGLPYWKIAEGLDYRSAASVSNRTRRLIEEGKLEKNNIPRRRRSKLNSGGDLT